MESDDHFYRWGVAQKIGWACGPPVCTRLKHDDEVTDRGGGQMCAIGNAVEWRAEASDDVAALLCRAIEPVSNQNRIVSAQYLTEVTGCCQMMV